ncbi:hypothetical protein CMV_018312 [Castanea mollissima]|uniref:Uncharacterized protein n=1 Tax=Castanea mollissima TaxID=60419 RepID=A0A8J4QRQ9_9ROSI|nr:hypothetical protein CMV_018312 [Castanea mollissima]
MTTTSTSGASFSNSIIVLPFPMNCCKILNVETAVCESCGCSDCKNSRDPHFLEKPYISLFQQLITGDFADSQNKRRASFKDLTAELTKSHAQISVLARKQD